MIRARSVAWVGMLLFWLVLVGLVTGGGLPVVDAILLAVLLVAVPAMSLAQVPLLEGVEIERLPAYWSSIAALWLVGTACWLVGTREHGAAALGLVALPPAALAAWTLALTAATLAVIEIFRRLGVAFGHPDTPLLRQLLPRTTEEKAVFAALSTAAGAGEELAYRGYAITVLAPVLGLAPAAVGSTVVFGIIHAYQGTMGVVRTGVMGGVLAGGFLACGSLWPPILAHTLVDLLAGLVLGDRLLVDTAKPTAE